MVNKGIFSLKLVIPILTFSLKNLNRKLYHHQNQ